MKYAIIEARSVSELQDHVQAYLNDGWDLQGGVAVSTHSVGNWWYYQALVQR